MERNIQPLEKVGYYGHRGACNYWPNVEVHQYYHSLLNYTQNCCIITTPEASEVIPGHNAIAIFRVKKLHNVQENS